MINIIKKGNLFPYQLTCPKCGCIFEFQDEDIEVKQVMYNEWIWMMRCPTCGEVIRSYSSNKWRKDNKS